MFITFAWEKLLMAGFYVEVLFILIGNRHNSQDLNP
jgi:hypothetical protein